MRLSRLLAVHVGCSPLRAAICAFGISTAFGLSLGVFYLALAGAILVTRETLERQAHPLFNRSSHRSRSRRCDGDGHHQFFRLVQPHHRAGGRDLLSAKSQPRGAAGYRRSSRSSSPQGRIFWLGARVLEAVALEEEGHWTGGTPRRLPARLARAGPGLDLRLAPLRGQCGLRELDHDLSSIGSGRNLRSLSRSRPASSSGWSPPSAFCPCLRPAQVSALWWKWTESLPRFPEVIPARGAVFSSGMILVVLNRALPRRQCRGRAFSLERPRLAGRRQPEGLRARRRRGALITTVILSAIVLTAIFQQDIKVARRVELKILAYLWVVQNLALILSVTEKMRRYIMDL